MLINPSVGQRVALTRNMLRMGLPDLRGTIKSVDTMNRVIGVRWDDGHKTHVLSCNLIRTDRIHLEAV
jgi:hypothetical protein